MKSNTNYKNAVHISKIMGITIVPLDAAPIRFADEKERFILGFISQVRGWKFKVRDELIQTINKTPIQISIWNALSFMVDNKAGWIDGKRARLLLFELEEDATHLTSADVTITQTSFNNNFAVWKIELIKTTSDTVDERVWYVHAKLVMTEEQMYKVATLANDSKIPYGKTIQLQADAHIAGSYTWIGMIASYDDVAIPFVTVSADIGCGLSILPVVRPFDVVRLELDGDLNTHMFVDRKYISMFDDNASTLCMRTGGFALIYNRDIDVTCVVRCTFQTDQTEHGTIVVKCCTCMLPENVSIDDIPHVPWYASTNPLHLKTTDFSKPELEKFKTKFMLDARSSLFRGKKSDTGDTSNVIALFNEALMFFGSQIRMDDFIAELDYVFSTLEVNTHGHDSLMFASRFMQSLGSSGNHFIELAASSTDHTLYTVTHSGSRGLGALIYAKISELARIYSGTNIASGNLAQVYRRAFDVLCKFAQINRILCGMAVLKQMGFIIDGCILKQTMICSPMFDTPSAPMISDTQRTKLLFGLTHNGIKTFVNHVDCQIIHIMSKGAVALSRRCDIGIVALRAGDGCDLFILNDPDAKWVEIENSDSMYSHYTQIFDLGLTDLCFAGHGAGRSGSATATSKQSSYDTMMEYYGKIGFIGNISPGIIGDNPEIAYKAPAEIRDKLPLDTAVYHTNLKTLVNHKEGINYRWSKQFARFCVEKYATLTDDAKLWLDMGLVRNESGVMELFVDQQERIEQFMQCYPCTVI